MVVRESTCGLGQFARLRAATPPTAPRSGPRRALGHARPVLEFEIGGEQEALLAVFEGGSEVLLSPQRTAGFHEPGLQVEDELQNRYVAGPVSEALPSHQIAKLAGRDVRHWDAEECDPRVQEPELVEQLSFGVTYGDQLAPANSDALATMVVDLRRERERVIDAVLRIDLRDGADWYGEEIGHDTDDSVARAPGLGYNYRSG